MEEKNKVRKLSYADLENAAKQISVQADALAKENKQLKLALQQASITNMYTELNFKFKVIKYADFFDEDFVTMCKKSIQDTMTPLEETTKETEA